MYSHGHLLNNVNGHKHRVYAQVPILASCRPSTRWRLVSSVMSKLFHY